MRFRASRLEFDVTSGGILLGAHSRGKVPTGETVLHVNNNTDARIKVLLLRNSPPVEQLPRSVLDAVDARESSLVIAASPLLKARKNEMSSGGIGYAIDSTSFHVYFRQGTRYTVAVVDPSGHVIGRTLTSGGVS